MKKQRRRPSRRTQPVKDSGQAGKPGGVAIVVCSGMSPRFDPPELLWRLVERGREQGQAGRPGAYYHFAHDLLAPRVVFTREFATAADDLRSEDLGVTVVSLAGAGVPPGLTWWEWDAQLPNNIPPELGQLDVERTGALVRADASGRRGTMHFACCGVEAGGRPGRRIEILPLAINFDWRDDFEAPHSLLERASVDDVRRHHAADPYPTLGQAEASPVFTAALTRRFGVAESPYVAKDYARATGIRGSEPWYRVAPHLLGIGTAESMQEATFLLAALLLADTRCVTTTAVPRGTPLPGRSHWGTRAMLNYNVVDYTPAAQRPSGGPPSAGLSIGQE